MRTSEKIPVYLRWRFMHEHVNLQESSCESLGKFSMNLCRSSLPISGEVPCNLRKKFFVNLRDTVLWSSGKFPVNFWQIGCEPLEVLCEPLESSLWTSAKFRGNFSKVCWELLEVLCELLPSYPNFWKVLWTSSKFSELLTLSWPFDNFPCLLAKFLAFGKFIELSESYLKL